jgi:hypothetical protein
LIDKKRMIRDDKRLGEGEEGKKCEKKVRNEKNRMIKNERKVRNVRRR